MPVGTDELGGQKDSSKKIKESVVFLRNAKKHLFHFGFLN